MGEWSLDRVRTGLAARPPRRRRARMRTAAVAVALRVSGSGLEVLFIRRPERRDDRWSGDVAFPGGLAEPGDASPEDTARRETREEVGLELGPALGRLRDQLTAEPRRARPMRIVPVVFEAPGDAPLAPSPAEVAEAFWMALEDVARRPRRIAWKPVGRLRVPAPVVDLDGRTLWGLTLRMIDDLLRALR